MIVNKCKYIHVMFKWASNNQPSEHKVHLITKFEDFCVFGMSCE